MSDEEAEARAAQLWRGEPVVRRLSTGKCCVGFADSEFIYWMGFGATFEEAFQDAENRQ